MNTRFWLIILLLGLAFGGIVSAQPTFSNGNVINYAYITLTNTRPVALATNAIVQVTLNASRYSQYETCNLNNVAFYWDNGTQTGIYSYMEGNLTNEWIANALCTAKTSPRALSNSTSVLFDLSFGGASSNFLSANTGTATTNTFIIAWAGNTITTQNTLMGFTANTGEAPQLSCTSFVANAAFGIPVCNQNYGQYDNGAKVFPTFYTNYAGTTLPASMLLNGGSVTVNNGLNYHTGFGDLNNTVPTAAIANGIIQSYSFEQYALGAAASPITMFANTVGSGAGAGTPKFGAGDQAGICGGGPIYLPWYYDNSNTICSSTFGNTLLGNWNQTPAVFSLYTNSLNKSQFYTQFNYGTPFQMKHSGGGGSSPKWKMSLTASAGYEMGSTTSNIISYWLRVAVAPPNDINPSSLVGSITSTSGYTNPTVLLAVPSNLTVATNSIVTWRATVIGGNTPFTYTWDVVNTLTGAIITTFTNSTVQSGVSSYSITINSLTTSNGLILANVLVTDGTGNTVASTNSLIVTAKAANQCDNTYTFSWMGYTWKVQNTAGVGETGPTIQYCYAPAPNQYVDSANVLHLNQILVGKADWAAYVNLTYPTGYGMYQVKIAGDLSSLDACADFSPFQYDSNPTSGKQSNFFREIDYYEQSMYCLLSATNSISGGVQPEVGSQLWEANLQSPQAIISNSVWSPSNFTTTLTFANGTLIHKFIYTVAANVPTPGNAMFTLVNWNAQYSSSGGNPSSENVLENTSVSFLNFNFTPALGITLSNTVLDVGQYQVAQANAIVGTAWTYNFIANAGATITHNTLWSNSLSSNTYVFEVTSGDLSHPTQTMNASAKYRANTINTTKLTFQINSALVDSWTAANNPVAEGGTQTFTATTDSGTGTEPYNYNVLVYNNAGTMVYASNSPYTSATSNIVAYAQSAGWGSGTFTAKVVITDSASTPTSTSTSVEYTVTGGGGGYTNPSFSYMFATNTLFDQGQGTNLEVGTAGGTLPFTYNWLIFNSVTYAPIANMLHTSINSQTDTILLAARNKPLCGEFSSF